jgi:hypothetical protein
MEKDINQTEKEELKIDKYIKTLKGIAIGAGLLGTAYILGGLRGYDLGFHKGKIQGRLIGYAAATADIATIVKDAREQANK